MYLREYGEVVELVPVLVRVQVEVSRGEQVKQKEVLGFRRSQEGVEERECR